MDSETFGGVLVAERAFKAHPFVVNEKVVRLTVCEVHDLFASFLNELILLHENEGEIDGSRGRR